LLNATQRLTKVGGWEMDVENQTMFWTEETSRIHGFLPGEVEPGSTAHIERSIECYDPQDRPAIAEAFQKCIEEGQPYDLEFPFTTTQGRRIWIRTTARPVLDKQGSTRRVVKVIGNIMDITERKQTEKELKRYRDHLEDLVRERTRELEAAQVELVRKERLSALGQLTATVAHEIRNPLGTVRTAVFAIGDAVERNQPGQMKPALRLAERNIVRCDNIISELLDYSRDRVLQLHSTHIDTWLEKLLDEQAITPQDIDCVRKLTSDLKVPIDREHLRRAVINVVENAVQAMQEQASQEKQLTVSTSVAEHGSRLEIEFRDTGPGIPDDVLPRVFEPLFSTKSFGVGLGLSVVKNIMAQHGGGVRLQSVAADGEQPGGTSVVLWLPFDSH
jgi:PAS domain S-box-containing protein